MALSVAEPPLASWQGQSWQNAEGTAVDWILKNRQPRVVKDLSTSQEFTDSAIYGPGRRSLQYHGATAR